MPPESLRLLSAPTRHGKRHPRALGLMYDVFRGGFSRESAEAIAETYASLNSFPQEEMNAVLDWAERKAGGGTLA